MEKETSKELPPRYYLKQVAQHCPKSLMTYISLWEAKDNNNRLHIFKKDVYSNFLISFTKFRNELMPLVREGLVSIDESPNMISIELVGWDDEIDEDIPC
jgi:hypothetical protein